METSSPIGRRYVTLVTVDASLCLAGAEQQEEFASRGHNAALPGEHRHLHGGAPHGLSQQPVDDHLQPVSDLPRQVALRASAQGRY